MKGFTFSAEDCEFYVNEDKRTVVCVLEGTKDMFENFAWKRLYIDSSSCFYRWRDNDRMQSGVEMPDRFVGIAHCAEEDEWNEALGRKIAYMRLREKVYRSFFKHANFYINTLDEYLNRSVDEINLIGMKIGAEMDNRNEYIASKLSEA